MASVGRGELKASTSRARCIDHKEERLVRYGARESLASAQAEADPHDPARAASVIRSAASIPICPVKFAPNGSGWVPATASSASCAGRGHYDLSDPVRRSGILRKAGALVDVRWTSTRHAAAFRRGTKSTTVKRAR